MLFWQFSGPSAASQPFPCQLVREVSHKDEPTRVAIVILEERVQSSGVDENILGAKDAQAPSIGALSRFTGARGSKVGIIQRSVDSKRCGSIWIGLIVPGEVSSDLERIN